MIDYERAALGALLDHPAPLTRSELAAQLRAHRRRRRLAGLPRDGLASVEIELAFASRVGELGV